MANLSILHLFPNTLRLNGEVGNVMALSQRAKSSGFKVSISNYEVFESTPKVRPDIVFIGSGTLQSTLVALKDLSRIDRHLHQWVEQGTKILAVGSGFDLVSQGLILADGTNIPGLGMTNTTHRITDSYRVGEVVVSADLAGFINSDREVIRGDESLALGIVTASDEKNLVGYIDGYCDGKVWASNIQGPFLPMNPKFADEILVAVASTYKKSTESRALDKLSSKAREAISIRVGN